MILNELSKYDSKWREIAYMICRDRMLADDLVQQVYLKLMNRTKWNDYFVTIALRNLFIDHVRKTKDIRLEEFHYVADHTNNFEPTDTQQYILDEFDKLDWVSKELLLERSTGRSLRDIEKQFNINYGFTYRNTTKSKKQIIDNANKKTNRT